MHEMQVWPSGRRALRLQQMEPALCRLGSYRREMGVLRMRKLFVYAAKTVFALLLYKDGWAAVNVSFSSTTPQAVQQEFISATTGQYLSSLNANPFFPNTYSIVITGKRPGYQPPEVSSPIATATAVDELLAFGFGNGMDVERYQGVQLIRNLQGGDAANGTCAGDAIGFSPDEVTVSTATAFSQCMNIYNMVISTISQRWGYIYDPSGNKVGP